MPVKNIISFKSIVRLRDKKLRDDLAPFSRGAFIDDAPVQVVPSSDSDRRFVLLTDLQLEIGQEFKYGGVTRRVDAWKQQAGITVVTVRS